MNEKNKMKINDESYHLKINLKYFFYFNNQQFTNFILHVLSYTLLQ